MAYQDKRSSWINCIHVLFTILCLIGCCSCEQSDLPPIGEELSDIDGVSIIRIRASNSGSSSSGSGNHEAHIDAAGIDLVSCLGIASSNHDPIVLVTNLPSGQYRISAKTSHGGRQELTKSICHAFSKAFHCNVTRRMIEIDAVVLTCPDQGALHLTKQTISQSRGFYKHDENENDKYSTHFIATLEEVAWFAGYMARNCAAQNDIENRTALLKTAYLDETNIEGLFAGTIEWKSLDPSVVESSLLKLGFKLTNEKRTIPAIVIEPHETGQHWTYLNDVELESYDSNKGIEHTR